MKAVSISVVGVHIYVHEMIPSTSVMTSPRLHSVNNSHVWPVVAQPFCRNTSMTPCRHCRLVPMIFTIYDTVVLLCLTRSRQVSAPASGNNMNGLPVAESTNNPLLARFGSSTKLSKHPLHFNVSKDTAISITEISTIWNILMPQWLCHRRIKIKANCSLIFAVDSIHSWTFENLIFILI